MEKRLLLGYHSNSSDSVVALIKPKTLFGNQKPRIRASTGEQPL